MIAHIVLRHRWPPGYALQQPVATHYATDSSSAHKVADQWQRAYPGELVTIVSGQEREAFTR